VDTRVEWIKRVEAFEVQRNLLQVSRGQAAHNAIYSMAEPCRGADPRVNARHMFGRAAESFTESVLAIPWEAVNGERWKGVQQ
jgi:hypothetical protein